MQIFHMLAPTSPCINHQLKSMDIVRMINCPSIQFNECVPRGSGLQRPTKVVMISRWLVFIEASFDLFNAMLISRAASGSSRSIFHDKISHTKPAWHDCAHSGS